MNYVLQHVPIGQRRFPISTDLLCNVLLSRLYFGFHFCFLVFCCQDWIIQIHQKFHKLGDNYISFTKIGCEGKNMYLAAEIG